MQRKIVIGYDLEHQGNDALALGEVMCKLLAAQPIVAVVTRWHENLLDRASLDAAIEAEIEPTRAKANEVLAGLEPQVRGFPWRSPASSLHDLATTEHAGLIVIGSSHRGPVGQLALGSVGESLLHGAPCAIAVAPHGFGERERQRMREIAVAFDGSAEAWSALDAGIGLAERTHGRLTVIAVADYPHYGYATSWSILTAGEFRDFQQEEMRRILELAVAHIPKGLPHATRLLTGEAGPLLAEASDEFDLMVTGSRGYGPLRRTLLGSATRKLMRSGSCPVFVLPRAAGIGALDLGFRGTAREHRDDAQARA